MPCAFPLLRAAPRRISIALCSALSACLPEGAGADGPTSMASDLRDASALPIDAALREPASRLVDAGLDGAAEAAPRLDVTWVAVDGVKGPPTKGEGLSVQITVRSSGAGEVVVTPLVDGLRFRDFRRIPLGTARLGVRRGDNQLSLASGVFLQSDDESQHFALGSGDYAISAVRLEPAGGARLEDGAFEGGAFRIAESAALLVPVVYDARYLAQIDANPDATDAEAYLRAAFTRPNQLFTPGADGPDAAGTFTAYPGGFDEMMGVRHVFRAFPGFPGASVSPAGWCEDAAEYARRVLGMRERWDARPLGTRPERHGFDYLIALTPSMGGGVACGWLDVQVSSFIERDLARQQVIAVHETGHLFGAPHCDELGDGRGGALAGYVMCSAEKHPHYPGYFVWHRDSTRRMVSHWN